MHVHNFPSIFPSESVRVLSRAYVKSVLKRLVQFCLIASLIARVCTGKCVLCLKARDSYNNRINHEFNYDLHNLSIIYFLEMHMKFENKLY